MSAQPDIRNLYQPCLRCGIPMLGVYKIQPGERRPIRWYCEEHGGNKTKFSATNPHPESELGRKMKEKL